MDQEGTQITRLTIWLGFTSEAASLTASVADAIGNVHKVSAAIAKILKLADLLANAGTVIVPALYIYIRAPELMQEGVYQAYGATPP